MLKLNLFLVFVLLGSLATYAQDSIRRYRIQHSLHGGYNVGALAPVGLPNTIRKIDSWNPGIRPSIGYEASMMINQHWGISIGLSYDTKGMDVKDSVMYFHTIITVKDGDNQGVFEGNFSGKNITKVENTYLSIPVDVIYKPADAWRLKGGLYFAYLVKGSFKGNVSDGYIRTGDSQGERVEIDRADFDFSRELRKIDLGAHIGAERTISESLSLEANLNWGLRPAFAPDFKGVGFNMYNIFGNIGLVYHIGQ